MKMDNARRIRSDFPKGLAGRDGSAGRVSVRRGTPRLRERLTPWLSFDSVSHLGSAADRSIFEELLRAIFRKSIAACRGFRTTVFLVHF
jgi:hypothetical protein